MLKRWCWFAALVITLPGIARGQPHDSAAAAPAASDDEMLYSCGTPKGQVSVTLKPETEVRELITWAMGFSCKNFVLDPRIVVTGKKVSVIAPNRMSVTEAYQMFLVALSTVGLTVVPKGNMMRVVEAATAKHEVLPIYKQLPGDSEQIVRVVVRPSYAQPEVLKQAFLALKSDAGDIVTVGSLLVVTDFASAVNSMMSLKKLVDVPGGTEGIFTLPIHHGDAAKIAQMLTQIFGASPAAPGPRGAAKPDEPAASEPVPSKILVDDRTNTLVISATEPAYQRAKALVERLDIAVDLEGGASIHTYQLSSAVAEELAQTLTKAITGDGTNRTQRVNPPAGTGQPTPPAAQPAAPAQPATLDSLGSTLQGAVHIIADKSTNKLIVTASTRDFVTIREVIRDLDQPRRQVYIEAMILEVDVSDTLNFGASAHTGQAVGNGGIGFGGVQLSKLSSLSPASALASGGLVGGLLGAPLNGLGNIFGSSLPTGTSIPSYGLLIQALAHRDDTNILSTPTLLAVDNEEAKSQIGENVPFPSGIVPAVAGLSGTTATQLVTNVSRKDLALELDIKPHISADDTILLEIKHTNSGVTGDSSSSSTLGPTWTMRSVETRAVVRDQQTVLIGGLMQDSVSASEDKVPVLGDIPLLGYLFKYTSHAKHKTNLIILLTPYIIKDQSDLERIRQHKLRQNEEFFRSIATLDSMQFDPAVNYGRKRGLIEEINRAVLDSDAARAAPDPVAASAGVPTGRIELPSEPAAQ